jgi:hypothetical protein
MEGIAMKRLRRDALVAGTTAVVCFAMVVPLGSSGTRTASPATFRITRQFTVRPLQEARFANMDWNCTYQPAVPAYKLAPLVSCNRGSTSRGVGLSLSGDELRVFSCPQGTGTSCRVLFVKARNP